MKCKLSEKCEFGNLCKDATRHDSLTVLGCSSFKTKKPMTNEEWLCDYFNTTFRAMPTREKAEVIADFIQRLEELNCNYLAWVTWLKEVHKE